MIEGIYAFLFKFGPDDIITREYLINKYSEDIFHFALDNGFIKKNSESSDAYSITSEGIEYRAVERFSLSHIECFVDNLDNDNSVRYSRADIQRMINELDYYYSKNWLGKERYEHSSNRLNKILSD